MRPFITVLMAMMSLSALAQSPVELHGFLIGRTVYVESQPSWTARGFGRFDVGPGPGEDHDTVYLGVAHLGIDWTPTPWLLVHADGVARAEPEETAGSSTGFIEGYVDLFNDQWRLRVGSFWLPTSRENIDPLWHSRYSISYSALNTWIGHEVRPIGADLQYSPNFYVTLGATAFGGNDTMGRALWLRGWTFGSRLTVYDEDLPLPDPTGLELPTTKPVWRDLDNRQGYAGRIRVQLPERAALQVTHLDNRAELVPTLKGQSPWRTNMNIVGMTVGVTSPTTLAAEWMGGWTAYVHSSGGYTLDFDTAYVLLSHKRGANRWTARVERFLARDKFRSQNDYYREEGDAFTIAWLRDFGEHFRAGLEYVQAESDRPGATFFYGLDPDTGGSAITLELRYGF